MKYERWSYTQGYSGALEGCKKVSVYGRSLVVRADKSWGDADPAIKVIFCS